LKHERKGYVLGIDIIPGDRKDPKFAYVVLNENGEKISSGEIQRSTLLNFIREHKIKVLALDNIFELYPSTREIIYFLKLAKVRLIQVTGPPGKAQKLSHIGRMYKLWKGGKLSPHDAAELAAKLAWSGIGSEVKVFEDITEITISRTRSLGEGGQHQAKYARIIASAIQSVVKEIEDTLRKHNMSFDIAMREGDYGVKGAKIYVYEPYEKVRGVVNEYHGNLFRIEVKPLEKERLIFTGQDTLSDKKRFLICGIDPGETTGLAILDLSGRILHISSKKEFGLSNILETIYTYGKPVLIATDVPKLPQFIERICRKTGAILHVPKQVIGVSEKNEIIRQLGIKVTNTHERDALVAALMAYKKYQKVFQKIDKILSYIPFDLDPNEIKRDILFGLSIKEAIYRAFERNITSLLRAEEKREKAIITGDQRILEENKKLHERIVELENRISFLEREIDTLQQALREKEKEISKLKDEIFLERQKYRQKIQHELEKIKDKHVKELENEVSNLRLKLYRYQRKVEKLSRIIENLLRIIKKSSSEIVIKRVESLTREAIEKLDKTYGIVAGDVLYIVNPSGAGENIAKTLVNRGIKAIIIEEKTLPEPALQVFEQASIPILYPEDFDPALNIENEDIMIISSKSLEKAIKNAELRNMSEEERNYFIVMEIIDEYRKNRKKLFE